jgi:hypothetical protein
VDLDLADAWGAEVAAALAAADPELVALLAPAPPEGLLDDLAGEGQPDLLAARATLDGTVLTATLRGQGLARGAWLYLDLRGGPAPDLGVLAGQGYAYLAPIADWLPGTASMVPGAAKLEGDTLSLTVDVGAVERPGVALAVATDAPRGWRDFGPAGPLAPRGRAALAILAGMGEREDLGRDPDLAVALALTFGALADISTPEVLPLALADAADRYRYAAEVDAWILAKGGAWSVAGLPVAAKLAWAWPAAQAAGYGAATPARLESAIDAETWRFLVPDLATLRLLRDEAGVDETVDATARRVEAWSWAGLRYRAEDGLMSALCGRRALAEDACRGWETDRGTPIGTLAGRPVPAWDGTSATFQLRVRAREGQFVGDCATATTLAITALQAGGIPAIGLGWAGDASFSDPTHDIPLYFDGERFVATQAPPGRALNRVRAFVYAVLPMVDGPLGAALAPEPGGWARGGAVAGGWMTYGEMAGALAKGIEPEVLMAWMRTQAEGGWPGI